MLGWAPLTARTLRWWPLATAVPVAVVLLAGVRLVSAGGLAGVATAVIVAAVVAAGLSALADPADELLGALPVGPMRRLTRRAVLLGAPGALAIVALGAAGQALFGPAWVAPGAGPAGALAAAGLAAAVVAWRWTGADVGEWAALTALTWAVTGTVATQLGLGGGVALTWWDRPAAVAAIATVVALAAAPR